MANILLITPQFQVAKIPFLDGEFVPTHFMLQWSWGSGEQLSFNQRRWNFYDFGGWIQGPITLDLISYSFVKFVTF